MKGLPLPLAATGSFGKGNGLVLNLQQHNNQSAKYAPFAELFSRVKGLSPVLAATRNSKGSGLMKQGSNESAGPGMRSNYAEKAQPSIQSEKPLRRTGDHITCLSQLDRTGDMQSSMLLK